MPDAPDSTVPVYVAQPGYWQAPHVQRHLLLGPMHVPAVRPPAVGDRVELPSGMGSSYRDLRTVTAVSWIVTEAGSWSSDWRPSYTPRHAMALVVDVGAREPH